MRPLKLWLVALVLPLAACTAGDEAEETPPADAVAVAPTVAPATTAAPTDANAMSGATVNVARNDRIGPYLTDTQGRSLYLFLADTAGNSTCYDACAEAWPPYTAESAPTAGDPAVQPAMLGTIPRTGGGMHAYNGRPLYYYHEDQGAGDLKGQDIEEFGAEWYLVSPQGEKAEAEESE